MLGMDLMLDCKSFRTCDFRLAKVSLILGVPQQAWPATLRGISMVSHAVWDGLGSGWCIVFQPLCLCEAHLSRSDRQVVDICRLDLQLSWAESRSQHHGVCLNRHISIRTFPRWFHMISPQIIEHHLNTWILWLPWHGPNQRHAELAQVGWWILMSDSPTRCEADCRGSTRYVVAWCSQRYLKICKKLFQIFLLSIHFSNQL